MKTLAGAVLAISLVLLCAGIIFYFHIDLAPFHPQIEQKLERTLKVPVRFRGASFARSFPPVIVLYGLELKEVSSGKVWVAAEKVKAGLFLNLKDRPGIQISTLTLQSPSIVIRRDKTGKWNFHQDSASIPDSRDFSSEMNRSVKVELKDAELDYQDEFGSFVYNAHFHVFHAELDRASERLKINAEIGSGLEDNAERLTVDIEYDKIQRQAVFLARSLSGDWSVQGEAYFDGQDIRHKSVVEARGFELARLISKPARKYEYLTGLLTARLECFGEGIHPGNILQHLTVNGPIDIRDGVFHHLNLVREVVAGLAPMPGFSDRLGEKLKNVPEASIFQGEDMPFDMFRAEIHLSRGVLLLEEPLINHQAYLLDGEGEWAILQKNVDFKANLVLTEGISKSLAEEEREFAPLRSAQGRILIPFKYRGILPGASVYPDLGYIASQFFQKGGQQIADSGKQVLAKYWESRK